MKIYLMILFLSGLACMLGVIILLESDAAKKRKEYAQKTTKTTELQGKMATCFIKGIAPEEMIYHGYIYHKGEKVK